MIVRIPGYFLLALALFLLAGSRPTSPELGGDDRPEAAALLAQVSQHYARAERYRIEAVEELHIDSELSSASSKSLMTAISAPGKRYRFEARSLAGWLVQVSDGRTERIYQPVSAQYLERTSPGPTRFRDGMTHEQEGLNNAQDLRNDISDLLLGARKPVYLREESLALNGSPVLCDVIQSEPRHPSDDLSSQLTFWIDQRTRLVRKIKDHTEGRMVVQEPQQYTHDDITTYPVAELDVTSFPENLFRFDVRGGGKRVKRLADPDHPAGSKSIGTGSSALETHPDDSDPRALSLLRRVSERYSGAQSYHIEGIEEHRSESAFFRFWSKVFTTAIVAPDNRYRFEMRQRAGWWLQMCDGKTVWTYRPDLQKYTRDSATANGPNESDLFLRQSEAQLKNAVQNLSELGKSTRSVKFLPDETLELGEGRTVCHVVEGDPELPGSSGGLHKLTLWIDGNTMAIRKIHRRDEGSGEHYLSDSTVTYLKADIDGSLDASDVFSFSPPSTAQLVAKFEGGADRHSDGLVGKAAPAVNLTRADGKAVPLNSFSGTPVLIEFWATWCGPCISSMPEIEKLYRELIPKGLVVLSIDEDNAPQKAVDFWAKHGHRWPNFHDDDGVALRAFGGAGIPHFALIDSGGKIVFSMSGFDKSKLLAALSTLDPRFR